MTGDEHPHDAAADKLEEAHQHADPAKGNKTVDGGDRVNVSPIDQGRGVAEKDKKR